MGWLFRCALGLTLVASVAFPAVAQSERCTQDALTIDGLAVAAKFCIASNSPAANVGVAETFVAQGKTISRKLTLAVVAGARVSRTIDDVDLSPLGVKRSLHMTLAYHDGAVELEHALALPGATPVK